MSLVAQLFLGVITVLFVLGGLVAAGRTVRRFGRVRTVLGTPTPLSAASGEAEGTFSATAAASGHLAVATDDFGYWCLRYWASGASTNLFTHVGRVLVRARYGHIAVRTGSSRRRADVLEPAPLPTRSDGERTPLTLGEDGRPLQRLEADGGFVPFTVTAAPLFLLVLGVFLLPLVGMLLPSIAGWLASTPLVQGLVVGYLAVAVGLKLYHDTALVGGWEKVVGLDGGAVPAAISEAADTDDPASTGLVCLREIEDGESLRVLGRIESAPDGGKRLADGIVTTRGRGFLTLAALTGAVQQLVWTVGLFVLGGGAAWLLLASL